MLKTSENQLLENRWDETAARDLSESELLLYRSNLLGSDKRITNYGGGNTSAKVMETDAIMADAGLDAVVIGTPTTTHFDLIHAAAAAGKAMRVGDPLDPATEVGPLIRPAEVRRVTEWVDEAVAAGARCLGGGEPVSDTCYAPTVLFDPPDEVRVSREEVFGPVVCVYPYSDADEAIRRANALPFAFQASVFARNIDFALGTASRLAASAVMINDHTAFRVDWMPFAGLKESGLGVGGIPYTFHDMRVEKMIVMHSPGL